MSVRTWMTAAACVSACTVALVAQGGAGANQQPAAPQAPDPIQTLVSRLELEKYKATLKGLTQFGDRRQGTQRNRDAVNWIQKQLESYGYTNAERIVYDPPVPTRECGPSVPASVVKPAPPRQGGAGAGGDAAAGGAAGAGAAAGGGRAGGGNAGGNSRTGPIAARNRAASSVSSSGGDDCGSLRSRAIGQA